MADGSITFSTELDNAQLDKQLQSLKKKIGSIEDKISQKQSERTPLAAQSKQIAAELDAAKARLEYMKSGQEFFTSSQIEAQATAAKETEKSWSATQAKVERYDAAINSATIELDRNKEKAGAIAQGLADAGYNAETMNKATKRANKSMGRFALRVREVVRSALVFTLITQALAKFREWTGLVIKTNAEATASVSRLKAALLTLAQPLVKVILPAFTTFVQTLTQIVMAIARVFSALSGTTVEQSEKSAEALKDETDALDDTGKSAKKAAKSLAAFDEINQLSGSNDEQSTSAIDTDFSGLQQFNTEDYKSKIDEITAYVSGALLALGAILFFSGANTTLGLGLMAAGAVGLVAVVKENWGAINAKVANAISSALAIVSGALLAIGAVLCFSGAKVSLGIGLMAAGAAGLASSVGVNWETTTNHIKTVIATLEYVVGGALLALGALLLFTGANVPLGIAFIAAGAVSILAAAALSWDSMPEKVKSVITVLTAVVAGALLALGALLLFTGVSTPLGIAFLLAGAVSLATAVALNWDSTTGKVKNVVKIITGVVSGALLCVGAILAFGGVNVPLGIGLMIAGGIGIAAAIALNWNELPENVKKAVQAVVAAVALLGTAILTLKLLGNTLGFAAIAAGVLLTGVINLAQHWDQLNGAQRAATILGALASAAVAAAVAIAIFHTAWSVGIAAAAIAAGLALLGLTFAFTNGKNLSSSAVNSAGLSASSFNDSFDFAKTADLPHLATGAVIPPNREFTAVLGDQKSGNNIEAPEGLLQQMANDAAGANTPLLQAILEAIKEGKVMEVDGQTFGRLSYRLGNQAGSIIGPSLVVK